MVRYRTLAEEVGATNGGTSARGGGALREALSAEDTAHNAVLYLLLRAADRFHTSSGCVRRRRCCINTHRKPTHTQSCELWPKPIACAAGL